MPSPDRTAANERDLRLTRAEVQQLAEFNTRNHQGVMHNTETVARMRELQERFDTFGYIPRRKLVAAPPEPKTLSWWRRLFR